jgi:hypothetical protein
MIGEVGEGEVGYTDGGETSPHIDNTIGIVKWVI